MPILSEEDAGTASFGYGESWAHEAYTGVTQDDLGNVVHSYAAPVMVGGCGFAPGGTQEVADLRVVTFPTLYVPKPLDVNPQDRFTGRGKTYEVAGDAGDWVSPLTGWNPGKLVVPLKRITG